MVKQPVELNAIQRAIDITIDTLIASSEAVRRHEFEFAASETRAPETSSNVTVRRRQETVCGDVEIVLSNLNGRSETLRLGALFPKPFDSSFFCMK